MEKTIEIENLQQEVARLTAENETLKNEKKDLNSFRDMWFNESQKWEKKYKLLYEQVKALATMTGGLIVEA